MANRLHITITHLLSMCQCDCIISSTFVWPKGRQEGGLPFIFLTKAQRVLSGELKNWSNPIYSQTTYHDAIMMSLWAPCVSFYLFFSERGCTESYKILPKSDHLTRTNLSNILTHIYIFFFLNIWGILMSGITSLCSNQIICWWKSI